ncbi:glycosyltransferase [Polynucleobacter paneuropaeus]|nr:glycosyltransferase [Polynucleobacter paneuropaeus]MBT8530967.1 glycosyltransferase [Polynucleobacter paneuropaeus]MBT8602476.1 glycosyltransferase [Polynucleobacter paneuropaeus]MBT8624429.1 glycosyltransferase [Polynucleobacter paneuropaeus]MBT8628686.1 glycosyltransferase [Polynucleobacter paneuropaeus]
MNLTIITPIYNSIHFLRPCLDSVKVISKHSIIHIISDNNSTDGLQNLLSGYKSPHQIIYHSNRDKGPANAFNTVLNVVDSEIIGWLNSDDCYAPGAIDRALYLFSKNPRLKIVYGLGSHIDSNGKILGAYPTFPPSTPLKNFVDGSFICQPTVFFRREVFNEVGLLDEKLKTAFDFDLWFRIFKKYNKSQIGFINQIQAYSRLHDQCLTRRYRQVIALESMQVIAKYTGSAPGHWLLTYFDELCDLYPFIEDPKSLVDIMKTVLGIAKPLMKPIQFSNLVKHFQADYRLRLSNEQLFLNVQSDGWVSKKLLVKLRYKKGDKNIVNLNCKVGWPIKGNVHLIIRSATGDVEKIKLGSEDEFMLTLEAPISQVDSFTYWIIETRQFFIPAKVQKRSKDTRKLSFRVDGVALQ